MIKKENKFIVNEKNEEFLKEITNGMFYTIGSVWKLKKENGDTITLYRNDQLYKDYTKFVDGESIDFYNAFGTRTLLSDEEKMIINIRNGE